MREESVKFAAKNCPTLGQRASSAGGEDDLPANAPLGFSGLEGPRGRSGAAPR